MTISVETNSVKYQGDGSTTQFPFSFIIPAIDEIKVDVFDTDTGMITPLSYGQFSVTGIANHNGGVVTYHPPTGPLPSTKYILIRRVLPLTQTTRLNNQGGFHPEAVENGLDRRVMQIQQLAEQLRRAPQFNVFGDLDIPIAPLEPGKHLEVNSNATGIIMGDRGDPVLMTPGTGTIIDNMVQYQAIHQLKLHPEGLGYVFDSVAQAQEAGQFMTIMPTTITLHGIAYPGDYGGGRFVAVLEEPEDLPCFKINDQWYAWAEPWVSPQVCGYAGQSTLTGKTISIQAALDCSAKYKIPCLLTSGLYEVAPGASLYYDSGCTVIGSGRNTGFINSGPVYTLVPRNIDADVTYAPYFANFSVRGVDPYVANSGGISLQNCNEGKIDSVLAVGFEVGFNVAGTPVFPAERNLLINCSVSIAQQGFVIGNDDYGEGEIHTASTTIISPKTADVNYAMVESGGLGTSIQSPMLGYRNRGIVIQHFSASPHIMDPLFIPVDSDQQEYDIGVTADCKKIDIIAPGWSAGDLSLVDTSGQVAINGRRMFTFQLDANLPTVPALGFAWTGIPLTVLGYPDGLIPGTLSGEVSLPHDQNKHCIGAVTGNDDTYLFIRILNVDTSPVNLAGTVVRFWVRSVLE